MVKYRQKSDKGMVVGGEVVQNVRSGVRARVERANLLSQAETQSGVWPCLFLKVLDPVYPIPVGVVVIPSFPSTSGKSVMEYEMCV